MWPFAFPLFSNFPVEMVRRTRSWESKEEGAFTEGLEQGEPVVLAF